MLDEAYLLFELGTEELPPKVLKNMAQILLAQVCKKLDDLSIKYQDKFFYASPRRLAFIIKNLQTIQKESFISREGPFIDKAYEENGQLTKAALGFAQACSVSFDELSTVEHKKGKRLFYQASQKGLKTKEIIGAIIDDALKQLPIPKMMRWGDESYQFIRPVHWSVLLLADELIPYSFYGCKTSHFSYGHRFHHPSAIYISTAVEYVEKLKDAHVLVDWEMRKSKVIDSANMLAKGQNAHAILNDELVEEVTGIVEWPHGLLCDFDLSFLEVPQEVLISAIEEHQKCFALIDHSDKIINYFITMSNINSHSPQTIIHGNKKVMTARLSDASFFYDTDVKKPLEDYVKKLKSLTFQNDLGSVYDRTNRIAVVAKSIAKSIGADEELAYRAGFLSKADLMTNMVYEFTNLQGVIGKYYARFHGENEIICRAIEEQYWPKYSGDRLPEGEISKVVSLAEKLDTLVAIFSIGQKPTGDKDPFALRRAAIGILRILKEDHLPVTLLNLIQISIESFSNHQFKNVKKLKEGLKYFFIDRLKVIYKEEGVLSEVFEAVRDFENLDVSDFDARIKAVIEFKRHPACNRLVQSNKRVVNILTKNKINKSLVVNNLLIKESEEIALSVSLIDVKLKLSIFIENKEYKNALIILSQLDQPISDFFNKVMVIVEDNNIRYNRLALLQQVSYLFNQVANLTRL